MTVRLPVDVVAAPGLDSVEGIRTVGVREIPGELMGLDLGPLKNSVRGNDVAHQAA